MRFVLQSTLMYLMTVGVFAQPTTVIGYLPYWFNGHTFKTSFDKLDIVVYSSTASMPTSSPYWDASSIEDDGYFEAYRDSAHALGKKFLLSAIGGYPPSEACDSLVQSEARMDAFVDTVMGTLDAYNLDGVEIDWEFPYGYAQEFSVLLRKFRNALDAMSPPGLLVTAVYCEDIPSAYQIDSVSIYSDWMMPMTYTLWQVGAYIAGFDTPINVPTGYGTYQSSALKSPGILRSLVDAGAIKSKMTVSMSFEGTRFVASAINTSYSAWTFCSSSTSGIGAYAAIPTSGRVWDEQAQANYCKDGSYIYSFQDTNSVKAIVQFAKDSLYGGIMVYDYPAGYDDEGIEDAMLGVVYREVHSGETPTSYQRKRLFFRK